jgi:hypothetical protein
MSDSVLEVDPAHPFDCLFEKRKKFGEYLVRFIEQAGVNERTVCIDAGWGYGKTTFLNSLAKALENKKHAVFRYNAWENDYAQDALTSLIRELLPQMIAYANPINLGEKIVIEAIADIVSGGNSILKFITHENILSGAKEFSTNKETIKKKLFTPKNGTDVQTLQDVDSLTKLKKDFIDSLVKFQEQFSKERKIVILVDELDRCRPSYALEVLERIKHFFDVPNYLFVFAVNKKPLEEVIRLTYVDVDCEGYFRRFFDCELFLPDPDRVEFLNAKKEELNNRFSKHKNLIALSFRLLEKQIISLRDCEKASVFLESCLLGMPDSFCSEMQFYFSLGILFYVQDIELFRKYYIDHVDLDDKDLKRLARYDSLFTIERDQSEQTYTLADFLSILHVLKDESLLYSYRNGQAYINISLSGENNKIGIIPFAIYGEEQNTGEGDLFIQDKGDIALIDQLFAFTSSVVTPQEAQS